MDIWNELTDSFNKDMAIDEMRKKYENTHLVLIKPDGSENLVTYKGYSEGFHWFRDELDVHLKLRHETECKIVCVFPERRLFNSGKLAYEFVRLPNRQYRRGICKDNVRIYSPVRMIWNDGGNSWNLPVLRDALYPQYPHCAEEAIKQLDEHQVISIALSDKFMLSLSFTTKKDCYYLWYCNKCIGSFQKGVFQVEHKLFTQEVLDNVNLFKPYRIEF
jgi:hypothetical protein